MKIYNKKTVLLKKVVATITLACFTIIAYPLEQDYLRYFTQISLLTSNGDNAPYWLTANKQGLYSTDCTNYYGRFGFELGGTFEKTDFGYKTVADIICGHNQNADLYIQQLFAEINWRWLTLSIGSKERFSENDTYPLQFQETAFGKNHVNAFFPNLCYLPYTMLSSGSLSYSGNSRPIPQIRIEIPEYISFPWTNGWLKIRAHIAYGMFTDGHFQEQFSKGNLITHYGKNMLYHSKAGFIQIGKSDVFPLVFEGGLEMYTQFGGDIYTHEKGKLLSMPTGISDFWKAFIPLSGSDDTPDVEQANISGNQLGSWHAAFIIPLKKAEIKIYGEHMFEDFSQLFFFEYQSDKKGKRNVIYYPWKDFLAGIRITNKSDIIPFLSAIQYEYLTTRDQSGALYHDPSNYFNEQMDGADNYYNHGIYPGWHHWGMGIGNPLVISPSYNGNGNLQFRSNRLIAHNIGINGTLKSIPISYRFNYTYSENWGTYGNPLSQKKYTTSILGDFIYAPPFSKWLGKISIGYDNSNYIGNNSGITFTLSRVGEIFNKK